MRLFLFLLFSTASVFASQPTVYDVFTTQTERERFVKEKTHFIDSVISLVPNSENEKSYKSAYWASELMLSRSEKAKANLKFALVHFSTYSDSFKYAVLQNIFTLYQTEFATEIASLLALEKSEKRFALMASYLIRQDKSVVNLCVDKMKKRFPLWKDNPVLCGFKLENSIQPTLTNTQIEDLIAFRKAKKEATIFVFVHQNRDIPGYAIVQNKKGEFLKNGNDTLKIKLLARSITNFPSYLTNGNTPQGVFSVQGFSSSDNVFIGKSPTVISALPFEIAANEFCFAKNEKTEWSIDFYESFFPESWRNYAPKNMAYYAGKAGRSEIIIHGTTIDSEFYKQQPYYPFTPSMGCICTLERWDRTSGNLIESEQLRLIQALKENKIEKALMYVIEKRFNNSTLLK